MVPLNGLHRPINHFNPHLFVYSTLLPLQMWVSAPPVQKCNSRVQISPMWRDTRARMTQMVYCLWKSKGDLERYVLSEIKINRLHDECSDFWVSLKRHRLGGGMWHRAPGNGASQSALRQPPLTSMYTHSPVTKSSSAASQCVYTVSLPSVHW